MKLPFRQMKIKRKNYHVECADDDPAKKPPHQCGGFLASFDDYASVNASFPSPHTGQTQSSGISSHAVPGAIPLSGSPVSGS